MQSKLKRVRDALLTVSENVGHYVAMKKQTPYIVWAEESESGAVWADNQQQEQPVTGTIDLFSKIEFDPMVEQIQAALNYAGISFRLNSVQHEPDTKYIHTEWVWGIA